jgi:hypothetical protein
MENTMSTITWSKENIIRTEVVADVRFDLYKNGEAGTYRLVDMEMLRDGHTTQFSTIGLGSRYKVFADAESKFNDEIAMTKKYMKDGVA